MEKAIAADKATGRRPDVTIVWDRNFISSEYPVRRVTTAWSYSHLQFNLIRYIFLPLTYQSPPPPPVIDRLSWRD